MYYSTEQRCTANISAKRNRIKQYDNTVYLKDGQSFEIELFNPRSTPVLAKISINGKSISTSGVIVKPGQRIYLERFIDEPKKFKFETYEVEDTKESKAAIEKNGEVKVEFFYEISGLASSWSTVNNYVYNPTVTTQQPMYWTNTMPISRGTGNFTTTESIPFAGTTVNYCSNQVAGSIETGRVEAGGKSNQSFTNYYGNFSWTADETVMLKIMPASAKPIDAGEIRSYCPGCGTRAKKSSWKFCPSCGTELA